MERKGGCCLAPRYGAASAAAGTGGQAAMAWQMGRIMLKFRPIAPKPAAMAPVPTPAPVAGVGAGKGKRKGVSGSSGGRRGRKPKKAATAATLAAAHAPAPAPAVAAQTVPNVLGGCTEEGEKEKSLSSPSSSSSGMTSVDSSPPPQPSATLPLLPVAPVETTTAQVAVPAELPPPSVAPAQAAGHSVVAPPRALLPAAAVVTVEDVTSVWRDGGEAPSSAAARAGDDVAPAFVSDQWGRVTWKNAAFHRVVAPEAPAPDLARVALTAKDGAAAAVPAWGTCAGFTCRVRVHPSSPRRGSLVAPCDVWRLDAGGCYLWRLDLQAALSLGLGLGRLP